MSEDLVEHDHQYCEEYLDDTVSHSSRGFADYQTHSILGDDQRRGTLRNYQQESSSSASTSPPSSRTSFSSPSHSSNFPPNYEIFSDEDKENQDPKKKRSSEYADESNVSESESDNQHDSLNSKSTKVRSTIKTKLPLGLVKKSHTSTNAKKNLEAPFKLQEHKGCQMQRFQEATQTQPQKAHAQKILQNEMPNENENQAQKPKKRRGKKNKKKGHQVTRTLKQQENLNYEDDLGYHGDGDEDEPSEKTKSVHELSLKDIDKKTDVTSERKITHLVSPCGNLIASTPLQVTPEVELTLKLMESDSEFIKVQNTSTLNDESSHSDHRIPKKCENRNINSQGKRKRRKADDKKNIDTLVQYSCKDKYDHEDVQKAASILCLMSQNSSSISYHVPILNKDNSIAPNSGNYDAIPYEIVSNQNISSSSHLGASLYSQLCFAASNLTLYMQDDEKELNSLHCFVRKHLLKLYVVPKSTNSSSKYYQKRKKERRKKELMALERAQAHDDDEKNENETEEDVKEEEDYAKRQYCTDTDSSIRENKKTSHDENVSLNLRNSSFPYGTKIGLQCVYCAHLPRKERSNMSTIHPRNISELYRYVCTWQRVHFYACPEVPADIRSMYWNLKNSDKRRGKTRYWVKSALKLGLLNCPSGKGILYCPLATNTS